MREFICPELQDRMDFHMTRFHAAPDQVGRAWVTIDGEEVLDCSYYRRHMAVWNESQSLLKKSERKVGREEYLQICQAYQAADDKADADFIFSSEFFRKVITAYPDISMKDALGAENPLIRAFALIDRRLGKRTFEKVQLLESEHPLVHVFYELRSQVFEPAVFSQN